MPRISKEREASIRARILQAAIDTFEENGFRRSSMNAIAAAVGLSSGAMYTYFDSKEQLFLQAFAALVAEEEQAIVAAVGAESSTRERIRIAIDYFVDAGVVPRQTGFRGVGGGFLVHAWANTEESPRIREILLNRRRQLDKMSRFVIDQAIAAGELPAGTDGEGLAAGIGSMLDGLLIQRAERGDAFGREEARRQAYAVVEAILHRG
jgi:AcrR family transcriptional regulator